MQDEGGKIVKDDAGNEVWRFCNCAERKRVKRLMEFSQITEEFKKKTFSNFQVKGMNELVSEAFYTARTYVLQFPKIRNTRRNSIMFVGRSGSGKTHLLMAVSNNLLSKGIEVVYFPWVEGFNNIKDDFSKMEERINRLRNCEVLFIDDMFKGRKEPTAFQIEQLFGLINYRYLHNKPILISSEKSIAQICNIDEAIGSRIVEICQDYKVAITGGTELNYRLSQDKQ